MIPKFEKSFPLVDRACRVESIDTEHIEIWSMFTLAIRSNIFLFFANNLKTNTKLEKSFPLVCRAC